jgi:hypothetical protein
MAATAHDSLLLYVKTESNPREMMRAWIARFVMKRGKGARTMYYMDGGGKTWTTEGVTRREGYKASKIWEAYVEEMEDRDEPFLGKSAFRNMLRNDFAFVHFVPHDIAMDERAIIHAINSPPPKVSDSRKRKCDE